ncbi:MAG: hypothetical protein Q4A43_04465 [Coriobacteriia bacterium]|nr:hypothetical protein [Coriobacteriia bacterium]
MMNKKVKRVILGAAVVTVLFAAWYCLILKAPISLSSEIANQLNGSSDFSIVSIEEMEADKTPIFANINSSSSECDEILNEIGSAQIVYKEDEIGVVLEGKLYSISIKSETGDETMSFTLNNKNELHINNNEKTYSLKDDKLYNLCSELTYS